MVMLCVIFWRLKFDMRNCIFNFTKRPLHHVIPLLSQASDLIFIFENFRSWMLGHPDNIEYRMLIDVLFVHYRCVVQTYLTGLMPLLTFIF
jgi:hypothetical protein